MGTVGLARLHSRLKPFPTAILTQVDVTLSALEPASIIVFAKTMSANMLGEESVKGDLFKSSGGGDLFMVIGRADALYKKPKDVNELNHVVQLFDIWRSLDSTDFVVPDALVADDGGTVCGYIMRRVQGQVFSDMGPASMSEVGLLPEIMGRVAYAMVNAIDAGIFPLVEHAGNVMISLNSPGGTSVHVIDVDGSKPLSTQQSPAHAAANALGQMETIFLNVGSGTFYRTVFDDEGRLLKQFTTLQLLVDHCAQHSLTLRGWLGHSTDGGASSGVSGKRPRSPSPCVDMLENSPWSPRKYQKKVFAKFGRSASDVFSSRFDVAAEDVQESDDGVGFKAQITGTHACVAALIAENPEMKPRYDELCILKTAIDQYARGGSRSHDLFLVRLFTTLFSGCVSPWRAHDGQAFRYDNGSYTEVYSLNIQQALRIEDSITKADACLKRMSKDKDMRKPQWNGSWLLRDGRPEGIDQSCKDPDESFSTCQKLLRDVLAKFLQNNGTNTLKLFCRWCSEKKVAEPLLSFSDHCVKFTPGMSSVTVKKDPANNCYSYFPKSIKYTPPAADLDRYDTLMGTLYGADHDGREIELGGEAIAVMQFRQPPRVRCRKGKGAALAIEDHRYLPIEFCIGPI